MLSQTLPSFSAGKFKFLKGEATNVPPKGHPAVIELWATWCRPCRVVFPHLSEYARAYKDKGLKVVSICVERDAPVLQQFFVDEQGSNMDYTVAVDPSGEAGMQLMVAAGGIPHALVVDRDGVVRFGGHPMDPGFEEAIKKVVDGAAAPKQEKPKSAPVSQSREELSALPVRELKGMLQERGVDMTGIAEKGELVQLILDRCT